MISKSSSIIKTHAPLRSPITMRTPTLHFSSSSLAFSFATTNLPSLRILSCFLQPVSTLGAETSHWTCRWRGFPNKKRENIILPKNLSPQILTHRIRQTTTARFDLDVCCLVWPGTCMCELRKSISTTGFVLPLSPVRRIFGDYVVLYLLFWIYTTPRFFFLISWQPKPV